MAQMNVLLSLQKVRSCDTVTPTETWFSRNATHTSMQCKRFRKQAWKRSARTMMTGMPCIRKRVGSGKMSRLRLHR